jgi:hypothetical protein
MALEFEISPHRVRGGFHHPPQIDDLALQFDGSPGHPGCIGRQSGQRVPQFMSEHCQELVLSRALFFVPVEMGRKAWPAIHFFSLRGTNHHMDLLVT